MKLSWVGCRVFVVHTLLLRRPRSTFFLSFYKACPLCSAASLGAHISMKAQEKTYIAKSSNGAFAASLDANTFYSEECWRNVYWKENYTHTTCWHLAMIWSAQNF